MVEMRHPPDSAAFARMNTAEMRATFLAEGLFVPGKIKMLYSHVDRALLGADQY
jgi:4-deoxy-L-threo-5-hexosulose-uronate ketol-isomerase